MVQTRWCRGGAEVMCRCSGGAEMVQRGGAEVVQVQVQVQSAEEVM